MSQTYTDLWVCTDCMLAKETDEWPSLDEPGDTWPWSKYHELEGLHVTPINVSHNVEYDPATGEPIEGQREFSTSRCDGCGSTLAGSRWRYAEWAH